MDQHAATPADVGAIFNARGYGNDGIGGMGWIIGLIAVCAIFNGGFGGFGGYGNRGGGDVVTNADLCNQMGFNNLENAVGRISDNQAAIARQQDNAICNLGYTELQNTMGTRELISGCCCDIKTLMQQEFRALEQRDAARTEAELRARVAQLEQREVVTAATQGVIRYPQGFCYSAPNPFFGNNCGNNNSGCYNSTIF